VNRPRVTSRPQTAMELAFNRAVQRLADPTYKKLTPPAPPPTRKHREEAHRDSS
jgi:hypothetical protein